MQGPRIIILTALSMEASAIKSTVGDMAEIHAIGVGAIHVPDLAGAGLVILTGLAGGLDPALAVGDVVIDEESTYSFGEGTYPRRKAHCATEVVGSVAAKAEIFRSTGAAFVEMESLPVRVICRRENVPLLHLRAISDAAGDAIDPAILRFVNPLGRPRVLSLVLGLARRPSLIGELRKLSRASSLALRNLQTPIRQVLQLTHP